jgi:hypothetical protein
MPVSLRSTAPPNIYDVAYVGGLPTNGVSISAYRASRFSSAPAEGDAPPAGGADAGPVVSGPNFGSEGGFRITLPTNDDYYLHALFNGSGAWSGPYSASGGLSNPMTAQDDLIVGGPAGSPTRLAKGASGTVLTVDATSGHLAWDPASGGLAGGTPALTLGTANAAGVATTAVRTDATIAAFDATVPTSSAVGDSAATGAAAVAARRDHTHGREAFAAPGSSAVGDAATAGTATTLPRSDHKHGREGFGTPGSSAVGDAVAAGSATTVAHSDHTHGREAFGTAPGTSTIGGAGAAGSATTVSHSDHSHPITNPLTTKGDLVVGGASGAVNRLGVGTDAYVLTADSTQTLGVKWAAGGGGGASDPTTTEGDMIYRHSGAQARLPIGTNGQILQSNGTDPAWSTVLLGTGGMLLGETFYNPVSTTTYNVGANTSLVDVDATNLIVTFTAPASGKVDVILEALAFGVSGSSAYYWGIKDTGGTTWGALSEVNAVQEQRTSHTFHVTGLTAGTAYTFKWEHAQSNVSGTAKMTAGGTGGAASMRVYDASTSAGVGWVANVSGALLAEQIWTHANYAITNQTTYVDVDDTNAKITFTVPASGRVTVTISSLLGSSGGTDVFYALATSPGGAQLSQSVQVVQQSGASNIQSPFYIATLTGLTPGASVTLYWQWKQDNTPTSTIYSSDHTAMRVYDATIGGSSTIVGIGAPSGLGQGVSSGYISAGGTATPQWTGDTAWTAPTLTNSWVNFGAPYETAGYRRDALGFVHLKGVVKSGTAGASIFTLPAGYRPGAQTYGAGVNNGAGVNVEVHTDGTILQGGAGNAAVGLSGITFLAEQ